MAQVIDITEYLLHAQDADATLRTTAESYFLHLEQSSYEMYLASLCAAFSQAEKPDSSRRLALIMLKNSIDSKDIKKRDEQVKKWNSINESIRILIKNELLKVLHSETFLVSQTASSVIAKLSTIEFAKNQWPELIPALLQNMSLVPPKSIVKQSTLETIGYMCEELAKNEENYLKQSQVNNVLTAIVQGMAKEEMDLQVRYAATKALYNALEFAHNNFLNERERNFIMQVVCDGTICKGNKGIRETAFQCLVRIANIYYDELPPYMTDLFNLTVHTIQEDEEDVAKQAIEFWSTICEEEIEIIEERAEIGESRSPMHNIIKHAAPSLVPVLLKLLTNQDEEQEFDENLWTIAMASGTCIGLISSCIGAEIFTLVIPYIQANICKKEDPEDWRYREAATFALGLILEAQIPKDIYAFISNGLNFLLNAMKDPDSRVRNTTAWTIGRILEFLHGIDDTPAIITDQNIQRVIVVLLECIGDEPHISNRVCYALTQLATGCKGNQYCSISPYFKEILQYLVNTAFRPVDDTYMQTRLQNSAFEAINEMVRSSNTDCLDTVSQLIPLFLQKLQDTFQTQPTRIEDSERHSEMQGMLCGCLTVVIQRLSEKDGHKGLVTQSADLIMEALVRLFLHNAKTATVHEEAMLAVGALTFAVNNQFSRYLHKFFPFLELGLKNYKEYQVCSSTIGTLSDICRAVEGEIQLYADKIMNLIFEILANSEVNREIKPQMFQIFADMAMALDEGFEVYLNRVLSILRTAVDMSMATQEDDEDNLEYNRKLKIGILDAYSGILQGLGKVKAEKLLYQMSQYMIEFVGSVIHDKVRDEHMIKLAVGLLGDIAASVPSLGPTFPQKHWIEPLITECRKSGIPNLIEAAEWAASAMGQASMNSATSV